MNMDGSQRIEASQEDVWRALNDPAVLQRCIPGCQELQQDSPTEMSAKVTIKIGPIKTNFSGQVVLSDIDAPKGYLISGQGNGGIAGFAKGGAKVSLAPEGDATIIRYEVRSDVGGKIAQLGARLIDSTARKLANEFFANLAAEVGRQDAVQRRARGPAPTGACYS